MAVTGRCGVKAAKEIEEQCVTVLLLITLSEGRRQRKCMNSQAPSGVCRCPVSKNDPSLNSQKKEPQCDCQGLSIDQRVRNVLPIYSEMKSELAKIYAFRSDHSQLLAKLDDMVLLFGLLAVFLAFVTEVWDPHDVRQRILRSSQ